MEDVTWEGFKRRFKLVWPILVALIYMLAVLCPYLIKTLF